MLEVKGVEPCVAELVLEEGEVGFVAHVEGFFSLRAVEKAFGSPFLEFI